MTKSNVFAVRHVMISEFIRSILQSFNAALCAHSVNISGDMSIPVICTFGLLAIMHNAAPPVPIPTSSTVFTFDGANAANHTASDVGL